MARLLALALLALTAVLPARAEDAPKDLYLAHTQAQNAAADPAGAMASVFRRRVGELTGGSIRVGIFPDGQLGGNRDMAKLVVQGVIHSALVTVGGVTPYYKALAVTGMPFALDRPEAAYAVYDGPFGETLAAEIEARGGLVVLGFGDAGGMHILTNSRRPIRTPADLAGLKLRTIPGYESLDAMIRGLGAIPVKVSSREEFPSLGAGIIDGQMNPAGVVLSRRYDQVQAYATVTRHLYAPYVWIFNKDAFARLSPAEQAAVRTAAREAVAAGRAVSATLDRSEHGLAGLDKRMQVTTLSAGERAAFKAAAQPKVADALNKSLGEDGGRLLAAFMAAARKANGGGR